MGKGGPNTWTDQLPAFLAPSEQAASSHSCKWEIQTPKQSLTKATGFNRHPCLLDETEVTPRNSPRATENFGGSRLSLRSPFGIPEHRRSGQDLRQGPFAKAPACNR